MIDQGLRLMVVGMSTVFAFLTVLVVATAAMSAVVRRMLPAPSAVSAAASTPTAATAEQVAAIGAAINLHRRRPK